MARHSFRNETSSLQKVIFVYGAVATGETHHWRHNIVKVFQPRKIILPPAVNMHPNHFGPRLRSSTLTTTSSLITSVGGGCAWLVRTTHFSALKINPAHPTATINLSKSCAKTNICDKPFIVDQWNMLPTACKVSAKNQGPNVWDHLGENDAWPQFQSKIRSLLAANCATNMESLENMLVQAGIHHGTMVRSRMHFSPSAELKTLRHSRKQSRTQVARKTLSLQIRKLHRRELRLGDPGNSQLFWDMLHVGKRCVKLCLDHQDDVVYNSHLWMNLPLCWKHCLLDHLHNHPVCHWYWIHHRHGQTWCKQLND